MVEIPGQCQSMTQKSGKSGPARISLSEAVHENGSVHPFNTGMFVHARDRSFIPLVLVRHPEDHIKLLFIDAMFILE